MGEQKGNIGSKRHEKYGTGSSTHRSHSLPYQNRDPHLTTYILFILIAIKIKFSMKNIYNYHSLKTPDFQIWY